MKTETDQIRAEIKIIIIISGGAMDKIFVALIFGDLCLFFFLFGVHTTLFSFIFPRPKNALHIMLIFL